MINTNANEIKKIIVNCDKLPKTKSGKNDRVAILKGLDHKHVYDLTVTFIYNDWDEYTTTFTITRLLENREWVNVKDTGEGRFGGFSLLFNSLLQGTFKKEAQEQSDRYYNLVNDFNEDKQRAVNEERQKTLNEQYKNRKLQNQLTVLNKTNSSLQTHNEQLENYKINLQNQLEQTKEQAKENEDKLQDIKEILTDQEIINDLARALSFKSQEKRVEALNNFFQQLIE